MHMHFEHFQTFCMSLNFEVISIFVGCMSESTDKLHPRSDIPYQFISLLFFKSIYRKHIYIARYESPSKLHHYILSRANRSLLRVWDCILSV